jgi:NAD(P)-dependent dehydrogenase (short-subunit alcohol dehydrogenase family)
MEKRMLDGKVAVVTGAGRGIGLAVATLMAGHGAKLVVNDPGHSVAGEASQDRPADEAVDTITRAGGEAVANYDSVADVEGAGRIVQQALDSFGRIDVVVNNAGILRDRIFHKMTPEEWRAVIDVHLNGSFNVSHHAARHFREQESGCFVHMTSTSGLVGNVGQANYAAAKMGIVALSRSIALDMARFNVRSNCISPFAWSRMIGSDPRHARPARAPGEAAEDDARKDRAIGRLSGQRRSPGRQRPDLCGARRRDVPHEPVAPR